MDIGKRYECKEMIRISLGRTAAPGNVVFNHLVDYKLDIIRVLAFKTYFISV